MKKILVVDDDESIRTLILDVLTDKGHEVITAINGLDGFNKIKEYKPDIAIVDIMMPQVNGYKMIYDIVNDYSIESQPYFIILSVRSKTIDKGMGERIGACEYLTKPFKEEELLNAIEKASS